MTSLRNLPLIVVLSWVSGLAMLVPMLHALRIGEFDTARTFFLHAVLVILLTGLVAVAMLNYQPKNSAKSHLLALFGGFVFLPIILAAPFSYLVPATNYFQSYFEMLSSFTTTGATLFPDPDVLSEPLHLWRALVAWLGGLLVWISAAAIMAPLNIGGFEVYTSNRAGTSNYAGLGMPAPSTSDLLLRYARQLAPIYIGLTFVLVLLLIVAGERIFVAVVHAMSTMSTSGITPVSGEVGSHTGAVGEVMIFAFLIFAVSRITFYNDFDRIRLRDWFDDKEIRLTIALVVLLPVLLFARHLIGAYDVDNEAETVTVIRVLWGGLFTVMSFLTTTGFESNDWNSAREWSGLQTPGLILMGLAVMGGGVATTAGGVKLLRVYAIYKHGLREMGRLSYPSSVAGAGRDARHIRRDGAYAAWVFFMLFVVSLALVMLMLALSGLQFEDALAFGISGLSTVGPLVKTASNTGLGYSDLNDAAKAVLCAAMVLGRLETLAIVALLNPDFWRK